VTKRVRITSELPPGATVRDDGTIDWSGVKADEPVWIRHKRPDGHRSLWVNAKGRWHHITGGFGPFLRINRDPNDFITTTAHGLNDDCPHLGLTIPTPEDLAWLRGAT
jgi:hypothetical protein